MLAWFRDGGVVGILDATNLIKKSQKWVVKTCSSHGIEVILLESKCDDEDLVMANIRDIKTTYFSDTHVMAVWSNTVAKQDHMNEHETPSERG